MATPIAFQGPRINEQPPETELQIFPGSPLLQQACHISSSRPDPAFNTRQSCDKVVNSISHESIPQEKRRQIERVGRLQGPSCRRYRFIY